ncbi:hypothetical protein ABZ695_34190 [Streptomyces sp. NPDC006976]|uniref:hypothetical protein n=1 Tax=Streptomyces sp. NPDC006976 TaxID=3154311 RepID=UPI0033C50950
MASTKQRTGLLLAFLLMGVSACASSDGRPSQRELKKIAGSAEVQTKREATAKAVRDRVRAIEAGVPWLKPLSVITYDQCQDVRGNAHLFDPNPPKEIFMKCRMSSYVFFASDRNPKDSVADILRREITDWTQSSVSDLLTYYGKDTGLQLSDRYVPSLTSVSGREMRETLRWDVGGQKVSATFPKNALWDRLTHRVSEKSIDQLRQENGVIYMWSLHTNEYHTVS